MTSEQKRFLRATIIGVSEETQRLHEQLEQLAAVPLRSLLVLGETGVGKDMIPHALARLSPHLRDEVEVFNCPSVPADHLESELFGTARGAYPGATDRPGAAERADGGVLFLDEIAAMPRAHQAKVLRLLESGEGRRLGDSRTYRTNLVVIAATHVDLRSQVARQRFREDLYYRLVQDGLLQVAPLRQRRADIALLASRFIAETGSSCRLSRSAAEALEAFQWPGNVRELRAVIRTAVRQRTSSLLERPLIESAIAQIAVSEEPAESATVSVPAPFYSLDPRERRARMAEALESCRGNQTEAGILLGLHRDRHGNARALDLRARKLAHRKFRYWWARLSDESRSSSAMEEQRLLRAANSAGP